MDDNIVHALKKFKDKCNQLVVGSNPTRGARQDKVQGTSLIMAFFIIINDATKE